MAESIHPFRDADAYVAQVLQQRADKFRGAVRKLGRTGDPEEVHAVRVAARRLHAALALLGPVVDGRKLQRAAQMIRRLGRKLGPTRDCDVQIAFVQQLLADCRDDRQRLGLERVLLRLNQQRRRLTPRLLRLRRRTPTGKLVRTVARRARRFGRKADRRGSRECWGSRGSDDPVTAARALQLWAAAIAKRLQGLLAGADAVDQPEDIEQLHRLRITAKKLRYTTEIFGPLFERETAPATAAARQLQECIGTVHDCDVWLALLPTFIEDEQRRTVDYFGVDRAVSRLNPGFNAIQTSCRQRRQHAIEQLQHEWRIAAEDRIWDNLRVFVDTLTQPRATPAALLPAPAPGAGPIDAPTAPSLQLHRA